MEKSALRKIYREKRSLLTAKERNKLDDLLLIQFQQLELPPVQYLLSYCPSETHAEPNTYLFSAYLEHMIPGLQLAYPVTDIVNTTMHPMLVDEHTEFHHSPFNIEEPVNGSPIEPTMIDMVFVPMLVCDEQGFRVGFGKGFYDRFLATCRPDVLRIGFSYFPPVATISDTHQFDIPLDVCITPEAVIIFN